ncbi:NINE protein [Corynebacterium choanae]|uniref:TM2 domain protein n=1 Tax=Corynebacterium choanae TaxID=1862358 RepID=A0A3G6J4V4_9CORY|nr:TM2 domain-containing protein [Corynebacterium choanae]AZA13057.1 TM2 domain protein [Corynebacterium choanae]
MTSPANNSDAFPWEQPAEQPAQQWPGTTPQPAQQWSAAAQPAGNPYPQSAVQPYAQQLPQPGAVAPGVPGSAYAYGVQPKKRLNAVLWWIFLGGFGAHNFYLGQTAAGFGKLALLVVALLFEITILGAFISIFLYLALFIWNVVDLVKIIQAPDLV